jgi:hypothetical protein
MALVALCEMTKKNAFKPIEQRKQFPAAKRLHPLCEIFPWMQGDEFHNLVADIRTSSQQQPILLLADQIIDGKNRELACFVAGVEPTYETYMGSEAATDLVVSLNWHRRHLSESQRAVIANKLWPAIAAELQTEKAKATFSKFAKRVKTQAKNKAAKMMNVSPRTVHDADTVEQKGSPEIQAAVASGNMTVSAAAKEITGTTTPAAPANFSEYVRRTLIGIERHSKELRSPMLHQIYELSRGAWNVNVSDQQIAIYEQLLSLFNAERVVLQSRLHSVNGWIKHIRKQMELTALGQQSLSGILDKPPEVNWEKILQWRPRPDNRRKVS